MFFLPNVTTPTCFFSKFHKNAKPVQPTVQCTMYIVHGPDNTTTVYSVERQDTANYLLQLADLPPLRPHCGEAPSSNYLIFFLQNKFSVLTPSFTTVLHRHVYNLYRLYVPVFVIVMQLLIRILKCPDPKLLVQAVLVLQ